MQQPRVIGRYRRSDGRIVRCDVEPEHPDISSRGKEEREKAAVPKGRRERETKDRSLARHEGRSYMLTL